MAQRKRPGLFHQRHQSVVVVLIDHDHLEIGEALRRQALEQPVYLFDAAERGDHHGQRGAVWTGRGGKLIVMHMPRFRLRSGALEQLMARHLERPQAAVGDDRA